MNNGASRYKKTIDLLNRESENNQQDTSLYQQYTKKRIDLLSNISRFYTEVNIEIKRKLLGSIFLGQLFFSKEKSRTTRLDEAARLILSVSKGFRQQKTGQLFKKLMLSGEVEVTGVEPVTFCMPCKRSSQLS
jgi:site-specific DNA recombinase